MSTANEPSLEDVGDGSSDTDMTTINATVSEVPCIRIPLQTAYVSPTSPDTAIFMYSSNTDNQGNVELHLRDTNEINEKAFTSVFGKLESDQDSYTISYQDDSGTVLHQNNIDILLGAAALQSNENSVNNFDIFETETKESELILSPKSFVNGTEKNAETNNNTQSNVSGETATEDVKNYSEGKSPSSGKKIKPKASSPNGWGPQQCSICSKIFGNTSALAKHKLTHSDERKYVCVTCGKAFKRQDHLNGHMLTHRHKKPFECKADGCGKSYCDARSLRRHTENHHLHPSLPIAPPTISVQEVISNTTNIPTCIHYAPKGSQSFQKSNNSSSKLPKTASNDKSIVLKTINQSNSSESGEDLKTNATIIHYKNSSRSDNNNDCLTQEQLHLIEHIVNEQRKKLKCEQKGPKQLKLVTHQQSTGSSEGTLDSRNVVVNSTVKITSTSVLVHNNKIKLLLQKGNIQTNNNTNKQASKNTIDVKAIDQAKPECKPVECNLCHRKFKNVPALNGHMRLHGGYFKKENDAKKWEKKESNGPQLTTASISVRALIEEKIIQKRSNSNLNNASKLNTNTAAKTKSKINEVVPNKSKLNTPTVKEEEPVDDPMLNEYQPKVSSFAIPAAPSPATSLPSLNNDLLKRTKEENENFNSSIHEETLMFNELLLKRVHQKPVKRASSDPGTMSHNTQSPQLEMTFSPESAYLDVYQNQNGQYFTNGIGDDMFHNVQDTDSMLLHNVDASNELNNLQQIENSDFQEISLEEYQTVTNDLQHQQDLQAVLNSPLPVSLAEFPYMQNETVISNHDQNTIPYSQSPLPSPSFTYPTPPASQEGQSPSFCHVSSVVHHSHVSSPLSSAFYSSGMSSPGAVEAALNEVLPMDVNQNVYPSPSSPSPLSVTPEPSPVSLSTSTFSSQTDLYHSQSQEAEDSLLNANQKEFVFRNNTTDDETYKFIENDNIYQDTSQEYQNVILNCNRLIDGGSRYVPCSNTSSINLDGECSRNITLQTEGRENITLYADDSADTRCNITFHTDDGTDSEVKNNSIGFGSGFDDANNDINFNSNEINFQSEDRNDISFYDKNITFQMQDKDVMYAEGRENITLHSENQGHVVLHSDDRGNVIIQSNERSLSFHNEENNNYEQHITFNPVSDMDSQNITLHIAADDYEQKLIFAPSIKDHEETFVIKSSSNVSRKRPLSSTYKNTFPQKSKLRIHRHSSHMLHYTPCPMLNPSRNSSGLYWQATVNTNSTNQSKGKEETGKEVPKNQLLIESDQEPHINIGPHFQANVEPCRENPHPGKIVSHEDLVWEPAIKHGIMDNELDMYLEFACCAALPGGGRNKEYALHVLHLCQGNIHEAVLKLMQPKLHVPADHPLLTNDYGESEPWSSEEIDSFQQCIFKFDKNFPRIAQNVGRKTAKQCIQFYYLWKKACPEEYKRCRSNWRLMREMDCEKTSAVAVSNVNAASEVETVAASTDTRPFGCEFPECLARFNSRAALNGHNRIHGGSADRWRMATPTPFSSSSSSTSSSDALEEFPCKLCGKVFSKIKSRSAHMKSHRPSEMEPKKSKIEKQEQKFDPPDANGARQSTSPLF